MEPITDNSPTPVFLTAIHDRLNLSTEVSLPKLTRKVRRSASQEALDAIREQTEKDYDSKRRFPRALLSKIHKIEGKKVVQPALTALDLQLMNMQKVHNRLHHAVMQKQAYLVLLSSELMHSEGDTSEDDQRVMQDCAYLTTVSALDREEHTQATLMHIIDREKEAVKMFGVPISETQQHIERIDRQIQDANFRFQRSEAKRQVYEAEARKWGEALSSLQKRRSEGVSRMLESYSDQQLLLTHFQREGEARQQLISEKAKAQSLLALEYELEIKLGTLHIEFKKKAEKLRRIESQNLGKVDSFKGSTDMNEDAYVYMINYWLHLNANSKHLEESSEQLLKEIENRNQERDSLKQTLTGLMETGDTADNTMQISNIEELLSYRAKDVEIKEINLAPLQRLQIAALNALSRVLFKVSEAVGEYNTMEQVEDQIEYCAQHLEKMLEEIIKASNLQRSDENLA